MPSNVVHMRGSGLPLREPVERCEACGVAGTVARALRFENEAMLELHRFCSACWPEERAQRGRSRRHCRGHPGVRIGT